MRDTGIEPVDALRRARRREGHIKNFSDNAALRPLRQDRSICYQADSRQTLISLAIVAAVIAWFVVVHHWPPVIFIVAAVLYAVVVVGWARLAH